MRVLMAVLIAWPVVAWGEPPPAGSEDAQTMSPYKEWITTRHDQAGRWCCDLGDMRPVDAKIEDGHWIAHVTPEHFPGAKDEWVVIPDERVVKDPNPVGVPILGWYGGHVQCFCPPDGV